MSLAISLRSELLKTKRTSVIYLTIFAAAFGPFASLLDLVFDGVEGYQTGNILNELMTTKSMMTTAVVLPFYIILVCTLLPQIEYRNHAWKQLLSSPQTKMNIFLAKFLNIQFFIILLLLLNRFIMLIVAVIIHFREPELHVLNKPLDTVEMFSGMVNGFIVLQALCCIQFWLGLRFRNFMVPIAIGIALWFAGSLLVLEMKSPIVNYFPYSFHLFASFPEYKVAGYSIHWTSLAYSIVFLVVGFLDFSKRGK